MRKPSLTESMVDKLRKAASYADADAEVMNDDEKQKAKDIKQACQWIFDLCNWYDAKRAKELRERAERKAK